MTRGKIIALIAMVVAMAAVGAIGFVAANPAGVPSNSFRVTAYAETGATTAAQVKASSAVETNIGVDGVNLTPNANGISEVNRASLRLLAQAHSLGKSADLLFGNYSNDIGDFSDVLAERMFDSPANIHLVTQALKHDVDTDGWDGVDVDLESLNGYGSPGHTRDDNAGLVAFVTALRAALGSTSISIDLTATTGSYADLGYNLAAIGKQVDHVVLMAYDQHGPTWSNAGPIGGYPWVKASLKPMLAVLPSSKIQLGIAEYGYSWPQGAEAGGDGNGDQYSDAGARAFVTAHHATGSWDATQREWHARLSDGTVLWWSDARSFAARLALAHAMHLGGVAVWSLGQSDPL